MLLALSYENLRKCNDYEYEKPVNGMSQRQTRMVNLCTSGTNRKCAKQRNVKLTRGSLSTDSQAERTSIVK